jgi:hypothetical protein
VEVDEHFSALGGTYREELCERALDENGRNGTRVEGYLDEKGAILLGSPKGVTKLGGRPRRFGRAVLVDKF